MIKVPPLPPATHICPSCGSVFNQGAITCGSCGGVIAVERIFGRWQSELRFGVSKLSDRLRERKTLCWTLALCPLLIVPPVLALVMSFRSKPAARTVVENSEVSSDVLIVIAAICNIALSVMFWRYVGDAAISMGLSIGLLLKSIGISHPVPPSTGGLNSI